MRFLYLTLVLFFFASSVESCKKRDFAESQVSSEDTREVVLTKDLTVYTYTDSQIARTNPSEYVKATVAESAKNESYDVNKLPPTAVMGFGMYVAVDPFSSKQYGSTLVSIPIKAGSKIVFSNAYNAAEIAKTFSSEAGVLGYLWGGVTGTAAVVRSVDVLDLGRAKSFNCSIKGTRIASRQLSSNDEQNLALLCDTFGIGPILSGAQSAKIDIVSDHKLSMFGAGFAQFVDATQDLKTLSAIQKEVISNPRALERVAECAAIAELGIPRERAAEMCLVLPVATSFLYLASPNADVKLSAGLETVLEISESFPTLAPQESVASVLQKISARWRTRNTPQDEKGVAKVFLWMNQKIKEAQLSIFATWKK